MLEKTRGSNDGINLILFKEGEIYSSPQEVSPDLLKVFLENNFAEVVEEDKVEDKAINLDLLEDFEIIDIEKELADELANQEPVELREFVKHSDVAKAKEDAEKAEKEDAKKQITGKKKVAKKKPTTKKKK